VERFELTLHRYRADLRAYAAEDAVEGDRHHPTPGVHVVLSGWLGRPTDASVVDRDA
jgi:hypothetical protein